MSRVLGEQPEKICFEALLQLLVTEDIAELLSKPWCSRIDLSCKTSRRVSKEYRRGDVRLCGSSTTARTAAPICSGAWNRATRTSRESCVLGRMR